jgi:uncharacterized protein (TIRG00374 family)
VIQPPAHGRASPLLAALVGLAAVGLLAVALDWHEVRRLLARADWWLAVPALVCVAVSYAALSAGLVSIGRILGIRMPRSTFMRIAFISVAINHVVSLGGVAGYSVRTALVVRHGGRTGPALTMSLLHSYLNNVMLAALLQVALVEVALGPASKPGLREALLLAAVISSGAVALCGAAVFTVRLRARLVRGIVALARALPRRPQARIRDVVSDIDAALASTTRLLRAAPRTALAPVAFLVIDWVATLATLWCCLAAFGDRVGVGTLVAGGAIGITAGFLSLIPGGLGVQEGSFALAFSWFGVQVEHAALAAVLFRLLYYVLPFLVSLPLYLGATRLTRTHVSSP